LTRHGLQVFAMLLFIHAILVGTRSADYLSSDQAMRLLTTIAMMSYEVITVEVQNKVRQEYSALEDIQAEVLGYLDEHPNAADSVEAIQQWWILQRVARYSRAKIKQALDQLVEAHLVEQKILVDGSEVYARAQYTQAVN